MQLGTYGVLFNYLQLHSGLPTTYLNLNLNHAL
jgi:hypothetical protein